MTRIYYSTSLENERMSAETPEEAVADWLECSDPDPKNWPDTVQTYAYVPMEAHGWPLHASDLLKHLIEDLDEEYGDPDEATQPTIALLSAAMEFCAVLRAEYRVWPCVRAPEKDVLVQVKGNKEFDDLRGPNTNEDANPSVFNSGDPNK